MATTQEKIELIERLQRDYDHAFLSPEGVREFTEPFGLTIPTYVHKANPKAIKGLTLKGGAKEAEGRDACEVAEAIARHLGLPGGWQTGRGFRLRTACENILAKLRSE